MGKLGFGGCNWPAFRLLFQTPSLRKDYNISHTQKRFLQVCLKDKQQNQDITQTYRFSRSVRHTDNNKDESKIIDESTLYAKKGYSKA